MDVRQFNRDAWDRQVEANDRWTVPVSSDEIAQAKAGTWSVILTPTKPVPRDWFPASMAGVKILCLASGGGQQGPILAATGADVVVYDNSPKQLHQDRLVADRDGLALETVEGDMADLSPFADASFDLIFHPCSNCFAADVLPVWREAFRVLRPGGTLLSGISNPVRFVFDEVAQDEQGQLIVRHKIPYSDLTHLTEQEQANAMQQRPLEFGHTLEDQLGGQLQAGFLLAGLFEDRFDDSDLISRYIDTFIATRAVKPPA